MRMAVEGRELRQAFPSGSLTAPSRAAGRCGARRPDAPPDAPRRSEGAPTCELHSFPAMRSGAPQSLGRAMPPVVGRG